MQKYLFFIIPFLSTLLTNQTALSYGNTREEIIELAQEDSKYLNGLNGQYIEYMDSQVVFTSENACQYILDIGTKPNDTVALSILVKQKNEQKMIPSVVFYAAASGKESSFSKQRINSNRILLDDDSATYTPTVKFTDSSSVCGTWGKTAKPSITLFSEFIIGKNWVSFVMDYKCNLLDSEKHTLVKTCNLHK